MATREKTCGTFDMATFRQATGTLKFGLYYGSNSSELSFSVSFAEEKRPHDAGGQLGQIGEPARSHRQWQSGHFTGEVHGAGEVHSLGYVVQVYGEVFHPVRVPEEAVPPQNIMLSCHELICRKLEERLNAVSFIVSLRMFFDGSAFWGSFSHKTPIQPV